MTPHNKAKPGDYADAVLLPGDPLRARWIAETFLTEVAEVNSIRNCLGYTGLFKGKRVSVQATGMGQPSLAIYVHELINVYGVKALIRVGTCGGLNTDVKLRDLVIAQGASTDSAMVRQGFGQFHFAPIADFSLLRAMVSGAEKSGLQFHVGNFLSSDVFYQAEGLAAYEPLRKHGVLGVDMEAAVLYMLAARFGVKAVAACVMSDCLVTHQEISPADRQNSLNDMASLALHVAVGA